MTQQILNVRIKPVTIYHIETVDGQPLGVFKYDEAWEGMQKFVSTDGKESIIIDQYDNRDALSKLFNDPPEAVEKTVIKISPSLFAKTASPKSED